MILYDARGNEYKGSIDVITNETVTDGRTIVATLSTLNGEAVSDLNGQAVCNFDLRTAAMNATLVFEGTVDGTNYFGLTAIDNATESQIAAVIVTTTLAKTFVVGVTGLRRVRVRVSVYASGNIVVAMRSTIADYAIYAKPYASLLHVTATAAINTASTATLPAAGAGLFHYITRAELVKLYGIIGIAAGAGNIITSTNLPGTAAWTTEQLASPAGTVVRVIDWGGQGNPIKSLVANTATTFVAPLQLQTIWRWNVSYYVGS